MLSLHRGICTYIHSPLLSSITPSLFHSIIIIIISHLLHENKSQVLTIQMADMQMEQARRLVPFAQNLPFQQILPTLDFFYLLDCLTITGPDWTYYAHHFIFSFAF